MPESSAGMSLMQLQRVCALKGMTVTQAQFDAGQTVTVYKGPRTLCRLTAEWSDPLGVVDLVANWLVEHGHLTTAELVEDASTDAR
jgi:hypothetical protein